MHIYCHLFIVFFLALFILQTRLNFFNLENLIHPPRSSSKEQRYLDLSFYHFLLPPRTFPSAYNYTFFLVPRGRFCVTSAPKGACKCNSMAFWAIMTKADRRTKQLTDRPTDGPEECYNFISIFVIRIHFRDPPWSVAPVFTS